MMSLMQTTERRGSRRATANHRTKMCWFYPRGKCAQDESCTFAHHISERRVDEEQPRSVCRHWAKGSCRNGGECKFLHAHDMSTQQPLSSLPETRELPSGVYDNTGAKPPTLLTLPIPAAMTVDSWFTTTEMFTPSSHAYSNGTEQTLLTLPMQIDMAADHWCAAQQILSCAPPYSPRSPSMVVYEYTPKDQELSFGNLSWPQQGDLCGFPESPHEDSKSTMDGSSVSLDDLKDVYDGDSTPRSIATRASGSDEPPASPSVEFGDGFLLTVANTFLHVQEERPATRTKRASSASP
eukprot:TRINITY_DN74849_c0_g1_i1.p1 TRINITY_DN74849_c0_g1~~TRINITY_DN74849_c0_g1_i1.p1  ORF type:complete len:295 (-),score=35.93 TRINITY_DN74849_c0_g1_i1:78-962(-)